MLKGLAQAKIIKKSVILFELINMTINNFISSLAGECAAEKLKNFCSSSLRTCLHHYGHINKLK